ncbi:MAG: hypothetical protein WCT05_11895 [Lentisphaeria bacterium]
MRTVFYWMFLLLAAPLFLSAQTRSEQTSVMKVSDLFKYEQEAHTNNTREYEKNLAGSRTLRQIPGDDAQVKECLRIGKNFRRLDSSIQNSRARQVELIGLINLMGGNHDLLPQEVTYINHYLLKLKEIGTEQDTMQDVLKSQLRELQKTMASIPPPPSFITNTGMKMVLIGLREQAFYISENPVSAAVFQAISAFGKEGQQPGNALEQNPPQGNITIDQAEEFCQGFSKFEGFPYSIPERKELAWAERKRLIPPLAVWCRSKWSPDWEELEAQKRFGISLYTVWDPRRVLSASPDSGLVGELKNAVYPQLGFLIITPARTGRQQRLQRLQAELLETP